MFLNIYFLYSRIKKVFIITILYISFLLEYIVQQMFPVYEKSKLYLVHQFFSRKNKHTNYINPFKIMI